MRKVNLSGDVMVFMAKNPALEIEIKITAQRRAVKMLPVKYLDKPKEIRTMRT